MLNRKWLPAMNIRPSARVNAATSVTEPRGLGRRFGDLKVRPKLIVLHNLFFLTLGCAVYFTLIPAFEQQVTNARTIEMSLISELFAGDGSSSGLRNLQSYDFREGTAADLRIPSDIQTWLDQHPGQMTARGDYLLKKDSSSGLYRRVTLPTRVYNAVLLRAKWALLAVLGLVYLLAVAALEFLIMPQYVYQPLRLMLDADQATRNRDHEHEFIEQRFITDDEIGQIMRSRNETVGELRRHEDELSQALEHLEAQDRLASLGLLSASVAHEMNTPLAVLHGSVEKLLESTTDSQVRERLQRMLRVTERLRRISEGLVDFARVREVAMGPVMIKGLIDEAWGLVSIDDKAAQIIFANEVPEGAKVHGNADRLVQVFVNVLRNALQVVPNGGHVTVRARKAQRQYCISVEDDGPGIPAEVLPNIFDAFVTSRLDARGTGLGLTVAAGIVQQHEGQIQASKRPGGGAKIEVQLRACE